jgi:hypothetical protein
LQAPKPLAKDAPASAVQQEELDEATAPTSLPDGAGKPSERHQPADAGHSYAEGGEDEEDDEEEEDSDRCMRLRPC